MDWRQGGCYESLEIAWPEFRILRACDSVSDAEQQVSYNMLIIVIPADHLEQSEHAPASWGSPACPDRP